MGGWVGGWILQFQLVNRVISAMHMLALITIVCC